MTQKESYKVEWRDIPGYAGFYKVSNTGLVLSFRGRKQKLLSINFAGTNKAMTAVVCLTNLGKQTVRTVASLMLESFVRSPNYGEVAFNKSLNKEVLFLENLEWATRSKIMSMVL